MSTDGASRGADSVVANVQAVVNELAMLKTSYANLQSNYRKAKERNDVLEGENTRLQRELDVTRQTLQVTAAKIENSAQSARAAAASKPYMEIKEELNDVLHQRTVERLEHDSAIDALSTQLREGEAQPGDGKAAFGCRHCNVFPHRSCTAQCSSGQAPKTRHFQRRDHAGC
ncbi:uncharacterized protein B0H18DRAFT_389905 [Fomitopsis serialis]|uniref:uncharacterized protein n=1 Tax=Fomitopsis serialis TaxID=139415 RepID=UPI00200890E0|nr:uncharacterized protein B0H18DRAFT_389905 [Neoantrodia serialis]KAH9925181.1 hypothetical protein B0H18DRAFT_389905 [Neoantrodia serialis]